MPIDFGNADTLNRTRRLFDNPTGWGGRVVAMLNTAFGSDNPFGSVALRDTGTAGGSVPAVDSDGSIRDVIGDATQTARGLVTMAQVETSAEAQQALAALLTTIGAFRLDIRDARFGVSRSANTAEFRRDIRQIIFGSAPSIILMSAEARYAPFQGGLASVIRYQPISLAPTADVYNNDVRIVVNGGRPTEQLSGPLFGYRTLDGKALDTSGNSISYLSQAQLTAFGLAWGFRIRGWGAHSGILTAGTRFNAWSRRQDTERGDADLLIAYKPGLTTIWEERYHPAVSRVPSLPLGVSVASRPVYEGERGYAVEIIL